MTNAPERIWIEDEFGEGDEDQWTYGTWDVRNYMGYDVEYVRADTVQALTAERDGLLRCVTDNHVALCRAEKAEAERDRLREALKAIAAGVGEDFDEATQQNVTAWMSDEDMQEIARAALKGESNE